MQRTYISSMHSNTSKPLTLRFLLGLIVLFTVFAVFDIGLYGMVSNGIYSNWAKVVTAAAAVAEGWVIVKFWRLVRN